MITAGKRAESTEGNGFYVSEKPIPVRRCRLAPFSITGTVRTRSLLRGYLVLCLHFTDGKMEARDYTICKKLTKAKVILSVLFLNIF